MADNQFEEPPELLDSEGQPIVVFRRPDGMFFSNHPEYNFAKAMHEQSQRRAAEASAEESGVQELDEDEPQKADDEDGAVTYEEMTSAQLVALAKERGIDVPKGTKRSTVIKALEDQDAAKTAEA
jgi:hypothetical protein